MQRIAVLTSGGDAPGMNASIRAVVRAGRARQIDTVGIKNGYAGLLRSEFAELNRPDVVNIIQRGGTILGTARSSEFATPEGVSDAVKILDQHRIDGLIVVGGDGTFRGADALAAAGGPPTVGVPGTIDNDVNGTDRSIGFDTAVNTALDAIDRVRDTATSHEMLHFVEVMGRHSGWLAASAGLAGGAEVVLCPEIQDDVPEIIERLKVSIAGGKRSVIIVVAEGFEDGALKIAADIGPQLGLDYRVTTLGHIQRGGSPTAVDRILGGTLGSAAVDVLLNGRQGVMVGQQGNIVIEVPFADAVSSRNPVPTSLMRLLRRLG